MAGVLGAGPAAVGSAFPAHAGRVARPAGLAPRGLGGRWQTVAIGRRAGTVAVRRATSDDRDPVYIVRVDLTDPPAT